MIQFAFYIQDKFDFDNWQWGLNVAMYIMERNIRNTNSSFKNLITN